MGRGVSDVSRLWQVEVTSGVVGLWQCGEEGLLRKGLAVRREWWWRTLLVCVGFVGFRFYSGVSSSLLSRLVFC